MATVEGLPPDSLTLLRKHIASSTSPIPSKSQDATSPADTDVPLAEAAYLIFNTQTAEDGAEHIAIPFSQPTRFVSEAQQKAIDLRSVYFGWLHKDTGVGEYINAVTTLNEDLKAAGKEETVTNLVFTEKFDLISWLQGDVAEEGSEYIRSLDDNKQVRKEANDAADAARGGEDVEMRDAGLTDAAARKREEERLREIYAAERKMGDRNTLLRGVRVQDFSGVRKYTPLFLGKSRAAQQQPQPAPALSNNPALRPPVKAAQPGRRLEPIILLSPSASSLLTMSNIKSFLVDGVYTPPESGSASNILHISRNIPSISSHSLRFILVDSPDNFRPDYWSRVVAVFTTGQTWQFKNYKWQNPAELFANALGVYVGWRGEVVPDTVKGWGRGVLTVQIDKGSQRWRDREVVEDVWSAIEGRMKAIGWGRGGR
ncbi:RNA pol II accessory factor, Cdc73 family-domain-containing protein [Neohortaea acidophila]|uniref:RNA pol II accessory factor, Cdc73 family-domain-containing protein n=1 Tax=Neohortaea acidophila TaxID=245834 RepID=A0A6A6PZY2_9PEZI|nr:RNA pol II accessory factor, Cdc73 family-domain-containing protein [Neohortaea acidophila]KAF2485304.1 RNA pol II accessory factor, Cdc73 family-domain-containing protein [Neohortaea acidophila]